jgi:hypothetical protein
VVGLQRRLDTPGNSLAELRMKASSEETWMKAANNGAVAFWFMVQPLRPVYFRYTLTTSINS